MSTTTFSGRHHSYAAAPAELTDAEVLSRFGDVIAEAQSAFGDDTSYYVEMASSATQIVNRRETSSARREALHAIEGSTLQEATAAALERRRRT